MVYPETVFWIAMRSTDGISGDLVAIQRMAATA